MKRLLAIALLGFSSVFAQTVQTTPNLITGTGYTGQSRTGVLNGDNPRATLGCCTGSGAYVDTSNGGAIYFSYSQATVAQTIAINQALAGSGVQVGGYNYSWEYYNQDYNRGTLTSTIRLTNSSGSTIHSYSPTMGNTTTGWTPLSGTQTFSNPYSNSSLGNLSVSFTGQDDRFWAGYYGPAVRNVNLSLNYTVDPCVANPLSSPSCANYSQVLTSRDISATSYAINQALNLSGAGVQINGFQYGYNYYVGGTWCSSTFLGIFCDGWSPSSMDVNVNVTSSTGTSLYSATHSHTAQNTGGTPSYSYIFPSQRPLSSMGSFSLTTREVGTTALYSSYSNWQYTPDPCTVNPLSSTSCAGYAQAYHDQQCSVNPLYASDCPGYAQAYFTQQCTSNPLYNATCPGYAQAYFTQQCTSNPLYSAECPGYAVAYHNQQCSISPLFMSDCPGYAAAYKTQQCNISALYATDCPGYAQAYFTQQCNLNGLYDRSCPNYATAYASKNLLSTSTTNTSTTTTSSTVAVVTSTSTTTTNTNPASIAISDSNVSNAISPPSTTSATSPTSVTSVVTTTAPAPTATNPTAAATASASAPPAPPPPAQQAERAAENKKTDTAVANVEKKSGGNATEAKKSVGAAAKDAAEKAANATTLEAQVATQGLVVGLMGYVPGFNAYQNSIVPDVNIVKMARQYNKPVIDNRNAQRRLSGASDAKWQEMVDSQYKQ